MGEMENVCKGFYTKQELLDIGFAKVGDNVLISNRCSIYQADQMEIGNNVRIDDFCILIGRIVLGNNIHIGAFCHLSGGSGIIMEDFSGLSQRCSLYTQSDDYSGESLTNPTIPNQYKNIKSGRIKIGKHSIIGASCVILPDVVIGEGVSVGAMSLINRSIDAWTINAGVPCKVIRSRNKKVLELEKQYEEQKKKLNNRFFVGQKVSVKKKITQEDVEKYAKLSGDYNGLHVDEQVASRSMFGRRVCHGMLIGSYISAVLGMNLPGEGSIYLSQDMDYKKPVYFNDEITITVEIEEMIEKNDIICLRTDVMKQDGTLAVTGKAKIMFKEIS